MILVQFHAKKTASTCIRQVDTDSAAMHLKKSTNSWVCELAVDKLFAKSKPHSKGNCCRFKVDIIDYIKFWFPV